MANILVKLLFVGARLLEVCYAVPVRVVIRPYHWPVSLRRIVELTSDFQRD